MNATDALAGVKIDLQAQVEELTLDLHLKDKRLVQLQHLNDKIGESLLDCE